jgi:hypothetical protein
MFNLKETKNQTKTTLHFIVKKKKKKKQKAYLLACIGCTGGFTVTFPYVLTMYLSRFTLLSFPHCPAPPLKTISTGFIVHRNI